jgi:hypothetical protein
VAAHPRHGLGQLGDRVVGLEHRAVPGGAACGQPEPGDALLGRLDQVEALAAEGDAEPADLADRLGDALEEAGVVVHQVAGTVRTTRLLVGQEGQDHIAGRTAALTQALADHGEDHRVHVLHVYGAAAPDAVLVGAGAAGAGAGGACGADVAREGVNLPVRRIRRDDVEVAVQQQRRPALVLTGDAGDHAGPAGRGFQDGRLEADVGQENGDVLGRLAFAGTGVVAPVGRIDPDQVAAQAGDLVLSGDVVVARGGWSLRHHPMVAPGWVVVVGWPAPRG